jgi:hypothetical protein
MISRKLIPLILVALLVGLLVWVPSAAAESSHARIIRLSLVQGDVRFARETHGDPLTDPRTVWETAALNLPIEQGYVLATDNGRAEVEFENGAMAFLKENTVLQFYDLSLKDGMFTTRLVLLQGSASFYVNPGRGDYFSVTGGDFTVEANGRATFRVDNFDNGSSVEDLKGRLTVLHGDQTTRLDKGQSLSMKAGDELSASVGRVAEEDDFDRWVSGRVDTVSTATSAALQYTSSPYYLAGFGSLFSYGSWFNCGGYGYGWRPFGASFGWSPFTDGQWIFDSRFGWTWVSFQPWGWAPYHYGGWLFDSGCGGWFYSPPIYYAPYGPTAGPIRRAPKRVNPPRPVYHAATAVFVRNNGKLGIVPMHPADAKGKAPLNLDHGVFHPAGRKDVNEPLLTPGVGQKWETLKSAPKDAFHNNLAPAAPPVRVSRTVLQGNSGTRVVSMSKDSSIAYDPKEHRYINSNTGAPASTPTERTFRADQNKNAPPAGGNTRNTAAGVPPAPARNWTPPRVTVPPPAPRYSGGERGSASGSGSTWSGSRSSGGSSTGSSGRGSSAPAPAPAPAPRSSSGGKPH